MIGYKAFNSDLTCRGFKYKVGKTYEFDGEIELCEKGFHFCEKIVDCFRYYDSIHARFAKVEALGKVIKSYDDSKCVTDKIRIIEEIPRAVAIKMSNAGNYNIGYRNTGHWNIGNCNIGDQNAGNRNIGNGNTGDWNIGAGNTGHCNTGIRNTGSYNRGNQNTGSYNTGHCNTGNWNTGHFNTGDWNCSSFNNGCFMTIEPKIMLFNKQSDWTYTDWVQSTAKMILDLMPFDYKNTKWISETDMTDTEKINHPEYATTGGYLKIVKNKPDRQKWWDNLREDTKRVIMDLPNFDVDIFYKCTGIKVEKTD